MSWEAEEAFLIPFQLVQTQAGRVRPAKDGFLQARKHPPRRFHPQIPTPRGGFRKEGVDMGRKKGEKRGFWGRKSSPGLGFSSSRKFLWGLGEHAP